MNFPPSAVQGGQPREVHEVHEVRAEASTPQRLVTILAFIAGYVDAFGFVALFGLFAAHVTANFVLIGANVVGEGQGILIKLLAFPAFIAGVAVARGVVGMAQRRGVPAERGLYVLQAVCLCLMMAAGLVVWPHYGPESAWAIVAALFGAAAMGVQNAHSRLVLPGQPPTTMMTLNVTLGVLYTIDALAGHASDAKRAARERLADILLPVAGFAMGAIVASIAFVQASFWALLFPVILLAILALRAGTGSCAVAE
ncbi:YoaK family protein [Paraburkholderia kururiensis]|uniref:YoaK family protein n=1 Tax=Paraburkholderia kururiensis TaxID=984307 RepID=UPI0009DFCC7D|nr:YoaK family protein [Paraburkholderia kururiensis]